MLQKKVILLAFMVLATLADGATIRSRHGEQRARIRGSWEEWKAQRGKSKAGIFFVHSEPNSSPNCCQTQVYFLS